MMASGFRLTRDAQQDLAEIRRYTTQVWGQSQSRKYLQDLRSTLDVLAEFPGQGTVRQDVKEGVLSFLYGSHMLYYRVESETVVVFAVLHQRMLPVAHIQGRRKS
ncbi:MAG: type II toxin-antitoxin system RelE/ParE family toxin [Thiopseudomonas sp.]|nr:type II toxin-antitoxin system RelE/ParE family toxin [Thiopseudomonas sp.]